MTRRVWASLIKARLGVKLVVLSALLSATVIGATVANLEVSATTKRLLAEELSRNQRSLVTLQRRNRDQLLWASSLVTENPTLRAAMETYRVESAIAAVPPTELLTTIQREVGKIVGDVGRDLLVVTDDRGRVLAAAESHGGGPAVGVDLSGIPAVRQAIAVTDQGDGGARFAMARLEGRYYQVGSVPIVLQGFPIGSLTLGDRLEETLIGQLREAFDGEILVATRDSVLLSTLRAPPGPAAAALARADFSGRDPVTTRLDGEDFVIARLALGVNEASEPVALYLLQSLTSAVSRLNGALLRDYLVYGTLAVLLAGLGAVAAARSVLDPFGHFVDFMHSVAASADWTRRFDASGAPREIRMLNDSYDHLIDSLAHNHAQLTQRTEELSRANAGLTEQIAERELAEAALRSSEEQLQQSQKLQAIGTLAGGVAHDFNNLLTVISSYTQLVLAEVDPASPLRSDLEQVRQAARRAAMLTTQLLAFSRKQVLQPKVIDLNSVVVGIETMLRQLIGEDINLQTIKRTPLARVKADPGQIEQVIVNLAVNSREAMPKGGKLTIETANVVLDESLARKYVSGRPGPSVMLAVSDTGLGMDEATRHRIFEPFFTTKAPGKGTGLGLSTVYGIVKQSGGTIWVSSTPGRGTTFTIYLPQADAVGEPLEVAPEVRTTPRGSETILLVEDEEMVLTLARRCLQHYGYRVLSARDGREALEISAAHPGPIHLLLTDIVMPHMSGKDVADRLLPRRPGTSVLYMSGYTDDAIGNHGVLDPGTHLLQKPFTPDHLSRKVRDVLDLCPGARDALAPTG